MALTDSAVPAPATTAAELVVGVLNRYGAHVH
jgi:hypothetical protein